jgi:hypothetical protein
MRRGDLVRIKETGRLGIIRSVYRSDGPPLYVVLYCGPSASYRDEGMICAAEQLELLSD